jgi:purine-binding chemotaxis protein CheW
VNERVEALKRDFDRAFAAPARTVQEAYEDALAIRVGGEAYAIRLADVAALGARPAPVPLPSRRPECLGLVSQGGSLAALYSLAALLGLGASTPRWMVLLKGGTGLALGFEGYEGYARIPLSEIAPLADGAKRRHVTRAAGRGAVTRLIIDIPSILNELSA